MGTRPILVSDKPIIFFDANCLLCSRFVKILLKYGRRKLFFASLDSTIAHQVLTIKFIIEPTTVVYFFQGVHYYKSKAIFEILKQMNWPWQIFILFKVLPDRWNDRIYDYIAKNRISWFGRSDSCFIPTPQQRAQFIE